MVFVCKWTSRWITTVVYVFLKRRKVFPKCKMAETRNFSAISFHFHVRCEKNSDLNLLCHSAKRTRQRLNACEPFDVNERK